MLMASGRCRGRAVNLTDLPERIGSIMGLVAHDAHEWVYLSKMTPEEVAIFNIYDNRGKPSIAPSALDTVEDRCMSVPRKSIESRTLARY